MRKDSNDTTGRFIPLGTVVGGLSMLLLVVFGWLFSLLVSSQQTMSERQIVDSKQVVANEIGVNTNARRLTKLENEQLHTTRLRALRKNKGD